MNLQLWMQLWMPIHKASEFFAVGNEKLQKIYSKTVYLNACIMNE